MASYYISSPPDFKPTLFVYKNKLDEWEADTVLFRAQARSGNGEVYRVEATLDGACKLVAARGKLV